MRLIIGNHTEEKITKLNTDDRIFPHRAFWIAEEGDIVILSDAPNKEFINYVSRLRDINVSKINTHIVPSEKYNGRHFDTSGLLNDNFIDTIKKENLHEIDEIITFWPSLNIAKFIEKVGLSSVFQGFDFFLQNGIEFANSKANFRALAAAAKIKIPKGVVCHTKEEAYLTIIEFFKKNSIIMVKQIHNGGGAGNEILIKSAINKNLTDKGARYIKSIDGNDKSIEEYLDDRWNWASNNDSRPVIIEAFKENTLTLYAEFYASDKGVDITGLGSLGYVGNRLMEETAPLRDIQKEKVDELISEGKRLAHVYRDIGYRGYLSADAILTNKEEIVFTEMNCRIGGSLHIYDSIANKLVKAEDTSVRTVTQHHAPLNWNIGSLDSVLRKLSDHGINYNKDKRKGIIITFPIMSEKGGFLSFCVVYENDKEHKEYLDKMDAIFNVKKQEIQL